jgi:hypothetical protein
VRETRTFEEARQWAAEMGLGGPLGQRVAEADGWSANAPDEERALCAALLDEAESEALAANADSYLGKLKTMLHWIAIFLDVLPHRILFLPLGGENHRAHAIYNEETKVLLTRVMRRHGSIAEGKRSQMIKEGGITAVVSTLSAYRSFTARYCIRVPEVNELLPRLNKSMRKEDGPTGSRKHRLGVEPHMFIMADATGHYDRRSADGLVLHCSGTLLTQVVGRGGEPGLVDGQKQSDWKAATGFTWADIQWASQEESTRINGGRPFFRAWWFPIKDTDVRRQKVPIPVSRMHDGPTGSDPRCAYDAVLQLWQLREGSVPESKRSSTPFFTLTSGLVIDTKHIRQHARHIATLVGLQPTDFGGSSFRIAGAMILREWCESKGVSAERMLKERGRWHSDIAWIYARMSDRTHLAASAGAAGAEGGGSTEGNTGWTQPAH